MMVSYHLLDFSFFETSFVGMESVVWAMGLQVNFSTVWMRHLDPLDEIVPSDVQGLEVGLV